MAQNSKIEWTDASWNPIRGCSRVSEGCRNCYAEHQAARWAGKGQPYEGLVTLGADGPPHWTGKVILVEKDLDAPLHWKKPKKIFVNSMSDLFHESVSDEWIDRIFAVMAFPGQHTFQILTKRAERMMEYMSHARGRVEENLLQLITGEEGACSLKEDWPLKSVWLGVSVEDQKTADERIPLLLQTPAAVRWVSYEPALGPVDFRQWTLAEHGRRQIGAGAGLHWIVCGGESGPGARPMHPAWARQARDQCQAASVPFFFKQWGQWAPHPYPPERGKNTGAGIFFRPNGQYGCQGDWWDGTAQAMDRWKNKKAAGRVLDHREWNEFPAQQVAGSR